METPLHKELERRLLALTVIQRKIVFMRADYYIRDRTFLAHMLQMDVANEVAIRHQCAILHGFNNQPGIRQDLNRLFADVQAHGLLAGK